MESVFNDVIKYKVARVNFNPTNTPYGPCPTRWINYPIIDDDGDIVEILCLGDVIPDRRSKSIPPNNNPYYGLSKIRKDGLIVEVIKTAPSTTHDIHKWQGHYMYELMLPICFDIWITRANRAIKTNQSYYVIIDIYRDNEVFPRLYILHRFDNDHVLAFIYPLPSPPPHKINP